METVGADVGGTTGDWKDVGSKVGDGFGWEVARGLKFVGPAVVGDKVGDVFGWEVSRGLKLVGPAVVGILMSLGIDIASDASDKLRPRLY